MTVAPTGPRFADGPAAPVLGGVVPPVCTPLTPEMEVDVPSLERLVDHLVGAGVDGLFVLGSTSEVAFLPDAHRRTVLETVVKHVAGQVPVLGGAIDMATLRVIEHGRAAAGAGCDGIVVTAPFYTRTHPAEVEAHLRQVAAAAPVPVFAYDLPVSVHSKLDPAMLLRLAAEGVVAGVKDSSGDEGGLRALLLALRDEGTSGFSVLTGTELTVDSALAMGVHGVVPGLGNVDPKGYVRLYRHCRAGRWAEARAEQERLLRLFGIVDAGAPARMGRGSSALGSFKAALHLRGIIDCPITAPPQIPLDAAETERVRRGLAAAGLL
ncbi:4-hydroxy-tetrahydrodipicolinate synthase [Actinomadura luteofluorescens]|uniref:4-hydroxy-tetrahydrodipicolinate synthase n=2 Tax=Actinomadura luteofluorescens TaxID=46163 RepID=A0A7Y9ERB1_9ACTN|nr:dihydrodipicolinate synthase family protein [Actinomadura luteofluorescens]NYD51650.1 4-hydroxy-tetrahydrodipicolinate synthase [Actinomadura luteofluorescens]